MKRTTKHRQRNKLTLRRDLVRHLNRVTLKAVAGGITEICDIGPYSQPKTMCRDC